MTIFRMRRTWHRLLFGLLAGLVPTPSVAGKWGFGHLAYGIGEAIGRDSGLRQNLDISVFPYHFLRLEGRAPHDGSPMWLTAGASAMFGFGTYPSYASLEAGLATSHYFGSIVSIGPAYRFGSERFEQSHGVQFRVSVDFFAIQIGVRTIWTDSERQQTFTVGVGRF